MARYNDLLDFVVKDIMSRRPCDSLVELKRVNQEHQRRSIALWNDSSVALFNHCDCELIDERSTAFEVCVMADYHDILKGGIPWIKFLVVRPKFGYLNDEACFYVESLVTSAKATEPLDSKRRKT
ncbi:hypothetical protein TIFTF001_013133 [Ficus carica]|uniref:Uncharacterized protein n=1 Tax=Ficus carica TaxID=3494 RepID=A0AA88A3V0_FICCA|nr:hypothetical protein TIFTF001_013133 [Ficus carica]